MLYTRSKLKNKFFTPQSVFHGYRFFQVTKKKKTRNISRKMSAFDVVPFATLDLEIQELIKKSVAIRERSYSPYSKFKVGAALLCADGSIFCGCNVECASYPVGTCAERAAIAKAVSEGRRDFKVIAVVAETKSNDIVSPCGMCRQMLAEFGDIRIYLSQPDMKSVLRTSLKDLLPLAFGLDNAHTL